MQWEIFDRFYGAHWFLTGYSCRYFSELLRTERHKAITEFIGVMDHDVNLMIFDHDQFYSAGAYLADRMINDHGWRTQMYAAHTEYTKRFFEQGEQFKRLPFSTMSTRMMLKKIEPVISSQERVRILGVLLNGLVLDGRNHLSDAIRGELLAFIGNEKKFADVWPILSRPTKMSLRQKKDVAIARLADKIKSGTAEKSEAHLRKIHARYCWLDYMYYGPPAAHEQYSDALRHALKNKTHLTLAQQLKGLGKRQERIMQSLRFGRRQRHLVWLAQYILWQKGWRKDVEYHGFYCYEPFMREVARRKKIKDWRDILYLLPWELEGFLFRENPKQQALRDRRIFSCLVVRGPKRVAMLTGERARTFYRRLGIRSYGRGLQQVNGQCAYPGKARGTVRVIQVPTDMKKMRPGDILVSQATSPDLLPAMKRAAAIITNTGGLICHAAIISRELNIPCIVGTGNANEVFKDGDRVTVDAKRGIANKVN